MNGKLEADMENPLNCVPPWMSASKGCNGTYPATTDLFEKYVRALDILSKTEIETQCKTCKSTKMYISIRDTLESDEDWGKNDKNVLVWFSIPL